MNKKFLITFILVIVLALIVIYSTSSSKDNENSWVYDHSEYPNDEYHLDDLPVSHKSAAEVRQFFNDSDINHDGILRGDEISRFDYKIKHSQYTFNGPYGYN